MGDCEGTAINKDMSEQICVLTAGDSTAPGSLSVGARISLIPPDTAASLSAGIDESGDVDLSGPYARRWAGRSFPTRPRMKPAKTISLMNSENDEMPARADSVTRPQLDQTGEIPLFMRLCTEYAYLSAIDADGCK